MNEDRFLYVERLPAVGETILAARSTLHAGGKGGNQAIAAARHGARVCFVGAVGDDAVGARQLHSLTINEVDATYLRVVPGQETGTAVVLVLPEGDNAIIVEAGANGCLDAVQVTSAAPAFEATDVVLVQCEVPIEAVVATANMATANDVRLIVNCAPFTRLPDVVLTRADPLLLNEEEARRLCGLTGGNAEDLARAVRTASAARSAVITLGAQGAILAVDDVVTRVPGRAAVVADTVGAGDVFAGVMAAELDRHQNLVEAASNATARAAVAVTVSGPRFPVDDCGYRIL